MMYGADAAEQMVRLSLEGMEVVLRVSGAGAKNLAVLMATVLKEEQQTMGKTRLTSLIKSGRELTVFSIPEADLVTFKREAKRYGVLYCDIRDKGDLEEPVIDIITRAEDAPKINRIIERFQLATLRGDIGDGRNTRQSPNHNRTEKDPRSGKDSGQDRGEMFTEEDFEKGKSSVREKLRRWSNPSKQKGNRTYARER